MKPPIPCNWVVRAAPFKLCGKPAARVIRKAGYCAEHEKKARLMFGEGQPIVKEELFDNFQK